MPKHKVSDSKNSSCGKIKNFLCGFGLFTQKKEPFFEVLKQLKTSGQKMSSEEKNILTNFLKFGHKRVCDVMVPRSDIAAVNIKASLDEMCTSVIKEGHTRTIIYNDTLDNVEGFIHIKDLFDVVANDKEVSLRKLVRKPILTTSSSKLIDLLVEMRRKRTHMAIVVDEYGGTEGIVTIEDIVEEIVGEIEDEHDDKNNANHDYTIVSDRAIITNARVEISELEEVIGILLRNKDEDVDTIGGLVMTRVGHMPSIGDIIKISQNVDAEVLDANSRVIKRLKITYEKPEE